MIINKYMYISTTACAIFRCKCGNCFIMPTARECVCCHELSKIKSIFEEGDDMNITCIIAHPGFPPACLNKYVLQIAYYQYKQQYGEAIEDSSEYV